MVQSSHSREFEITVDKLFVIDTISFDELGVHTNDHF